MSIGETNQTPYGGDDLKPCPFCGEKYVTTEFDRGQGDKWGYASCDVCAACGPEVRTNYDREPDGPWHSEAIAAWNTRADADRIEQLVKERDEFKAAAKTYHVESMGSVMGEVEHMAQQMRDRIKEFKERNKELTLQLLATSGQAADALDKLTETVEALRHTLDKPRDADQSYAGLCSEVMWEIRAVLVQLEGK
jgi:Lar family restriction alleviation protein